MASTVMFAQTQLHWTMVTGQGAAGTNTTMTGELYIDNVAYYNGEQTPQYLEIGVFDQDEICRGAKLPSYRASKDQWVYQITIKGNEGFEYHFKIWDHATETETDLVDDFGEIITWGSGKKYGSLANPYILNFTHSTPALNEYTWNVNEGEWTEPEQGANVTIPDNSIVIIPEGVVANAGEITMGTNSQIIIQEGGELYHSNEVEVIIQVDTIEGYGAKDAPAGYRLIASPVYTDAATYSRPVEGTNLNTEAFDLYLFDQAGDIEGKEWINFEQASNSLSNLYMGRGYLYATAAQNPNIIFVGNTYPTGYTVMKELEYTSGKRFAGWNLMGNPFTCKAYVTDGGDAIPYYKLNDAGSDLVSVVAGTSIAPLKGIFLQAESADDICVFTTTPPTAKGTLNINLSQDLGTIDNAIINFGEGRNLGKFQLNASHTKVYMTQNGKDYAVLHSGEMGEMPVSFKAENNGTYNLSFTSENVGFNYLHLIDNMTGADVDLLANPSYTFSANTTDYASRFKLVYATGNNTEDNFAFFNNGNLIINNEGAATVQVIDVTGRILSSESIYGSASINVNAAAGVYMIRLINGNDVKVQKMVVK